MKREGLNFILEMEDPEYDYFDDFYSDSNIEREKALFEKDIADDVEEIIDRYWNEDNIKEFAYYRESPSKDACGRTICCIIWTNYEFREILDDGHSNYGMEYDLWKYIKQQIHKKRCDYILNKYQAVREVEKWFDKEKIQYQ